MRIKGCGWLYSALAKMPGVVLILTNEHKTSCNCSTCERRMTQGRVQRRVAVADDDSDDDSDGDDDGDGSSSSNDDTRPVWSAGDDAKVAELFDTLHKLQKLLQKRVELVASIEDAVEAIDKSSSVAVTRRELALLGELVHLARSRRPSGASPLRPTIASLQQTWTALVTGYGHVARHIVAGQSPEEIVRAGRRKGTAVSAYLEHSKRTRRYPLLCPFGHLLSLQRWKLRSERRLRGGGYAGAVVDALGAAEAHDKDGGGRPGRLFARYCQHDEMRAWAAHELSRSTDKNQRLKAVCALKVAAYAMAFTSKELFESPLSPSRSYYDAVVGLHRAQASGLQAARVARESESNSGWLTSGCRMSRRNGVARVVGWCRTACLWSSAVARDAPMKCMQHCFSTFVKRHPALCITNTTAVSARRS